MALDTAEKRNSFMNFGFGGGLFIPEHILADAEFGARTLSQFDFADAGFGARTLGEYDIGGGSLIPSEDLSVEDRVTLLELYSGIPISDVPIVPSLGIMNEWNYSVDTINQIKVQHSIRTLKVTTG